MAYLLLVVLAVALVGCAVPSRTEPWCLPHAKGSVSKERVWVGVRCAW